MFLSNFLIGTIFLLFIKIICNDLKSFHNFLLEWIMLVVGTMGIGKDCAIVIIFFASQD